MMSDLPRVLHLVDDTTAGGVMRVLDFIQTDSALSDTATHVVRSVRRGKIIGRLSDADIIVSHLTVSWRALPALIALRIAHPRTPLLHVEHSYTENFVRHNVVRRHRFMALLTSAYALFDRIICVSNGQAAWMKEAGLVRSGALVVIQSCVDLEAFRKIPAPSGPQRVFGAIGRLDAQKGFDHLIQAFRQCPDPNIALHIIGTGAEEDALRDLARGDSRVVFKGFQPDTVQALTDIDVVVMPSRWEAYGLVAIEALAAGRRLLCHDIDGLSDHTQHGSVPLRPGFIKDLSDQIAAEARRKDLDTGASSIGHVDHLESTFRAGWSSVLEDVLGTAAGLSAMPREADTHELSTSK